MKRPPLICLNMQRDAVEGDLPIPRAIEVLPNALACLSWARRKSLPITHVFTYGRAGQRPSPLDGFQAGVSEIVAYKASASFFDSQSMSRDLQHRCAAFVLGFTGYEDCLAAAIDARRLGVRLIFVVDAIASPPLSLHAPALSDAIINEVLGKLAATTTTLELLKRETSTWIRDAPRLQSEFRGYHEQ